MRRGFVEAVWMIFLTAAVAGYGINQLFSDPAMVSDSLAQIGATLLVAFAVQTGWVVQTSRKRGKDRENWVGMTTGVASSATSGRYRAPSHQRPHDRRRLWKLASIDLAHLEARRLDPGDRVAVAVATVAEEAPGRLQAVLPLG